MTFLSFTLLVFSQEIFLEQSWEKSKGIMTEEKSYCHPLPNKEQTFCQTETFAYPLFTDAPNQELAKQIESMMLHHKAKFDQISLKEGTLKNLSDPDYQPTGTFSSSNQYDLFAVTLKTFTLSNDGSGYSGGAHGYHSTLFENYSHSGEQIKFKDLFVEDYNTTLHHIAQDVYKKSVGLKPQESLEKDGWFENKFILTPNVAITPRGLLFHYNSYEIKPYASGHTRFLLPYESIRELIAPKGVLKNYLSSPKQMFTKFQEHEVAKFSVHLERVGSDKVKIRIKEHIEIYSTKNWLSVSFPQLSNKKSVKIVKTSGFKSTHIYPKQSKIYHTTKKKAVRSSYLLVEGEGESGYDEDPKQMVLLVTLQPSMKALDVRIRGSFKNKKEEKTIPSSYEGIKGQQGYTNYQLSLPLE